ncbi:MAG: hypothetical protein IH612_02100 [Desulfofustis sp.]|nr:hypothetical protein [Desulfofustis sp.]
MEIMATTSEELGNHPYVEVEAGVYVCRYANRARVLFVEADDSAILLIRQAAGAGQG